MKYLQTYRQIGQVRVIVCERPLAGVTVGASAVRTLRHGVLTPVALPGPAPLHGAPVVLRCVSLRPPAAMCGGAGVLWLDVAPLTAVATPDIWPYLLVGFDLVSTALEPQSSLANEGFTYGVQAVPPFNLSVTARVIT